MLKSEKLLIFQKGSPGRIGFNLDLDSFPKKEISESHQRKDPLLLPEVSELEVMRHFDLLAKKNFCIKYGLWFYHFSFWVLVVTSHTWQVFIRMKSKRI